jgi:polyhydroxyalkanoate synthesis regulator phasin
MRIEDLVKVGIGSIFLAKEKMQELIEEAKKRGELTEKEAEELINEMKNESEKKLEQIREMIKEEVKKQLDELGVATKEDIKRIEEKIEKLNVQK